MYRHTVEMIARKFTGSKIILKPQVKTPTNNEKVYGLSNKVYEIPNELVGPGASKNSKDYKNPEYFCYHKNSYFEAEYEMKKYRCPQPSNKCSYTLQ